jgi:septum formation inhibitor MinC
MASLVDFAKYAVARIYPVLVWGSLMGLAVHAGFSTQIAREAVESEQISLIDDASANVPAHVYAEHAYADEDASDRTALP